MKLNSVFYRNYFLLRYLIPFSCFAFPSIVFSQSFNASGNRTTSDAIFHSLNTQVCTGSLGDPIVNVTFGAGPNFGAALSAGITNLQYSANSCPNDGQYTIANYTSGCFSNSWFTVTDHTGDANGYFMLINASYQPSDFYVQTINGLCSGTTYQFSAWVINVMKNAGIAPNITFSIEKTDGTVLQSFNSGDIPQSSSPVWKQYGMFFTTPVGVTSVVIRMKNNAPGGNGNDLALDDISFRPAGPLTSTIANGQTDSINICQSTVQLTSSIETCYLTNEYQWQLSKNNGAWADIAGATNAAYTVPVQPAGNYKYRLLVAQSGNIQISTCRVYSNTTTVVVVPDATVRNVNTTICSGQNYVLPSGVMVNAAGNYKDTVRYSFGCDSLITNLNLGVQFPTMVSKSAVICSGQTYTLPSGKMVSSSGIYQDTVQYKSNCDSVISTIDLTVKQLTINDSWATICEGQSITLPWGKVVSASGIYSDTLRYISGCDSLIRNVMVRVTVPFQQTIEKSICPNQTYTLPSGKVVSTPGIYNDTLRTAIGCDSIITLLTLTPAPPPTIRLTKSNDVTCSLGISKLNATGGDYYLWSPAETLNNASIPNPIASPTSTTVYHVVATTAEGCVGEDSIQVVVSTDLLKYNIYLPTAFTPNNDGLNDCFGIKFLGQISNLHLSIYNRWGQRIFYTTNPTECWDGTIQGVKQKSDVYTYQMSATTICGPVFKKGTVLLIR